jgi:hypothetical protein
VDEKTEEYRRKAVEAEQQADHAHEAYAKRVYQNIATMWREMAEEAIASPGK